MNTNNLYVKANEKNGKKYYNKVNIADCLKRRKLIELGMLQY